MKLLQQLCLMTLPLLFICASTIKNNYVLSGDYKVSIHGTSNLHSWDENVGAVSGEGLVNTTENDSYSVDAISIKMEVHSIKSDMGSIMNNNTYRALKADENPQITFELLSPIKVILKSAEKTMPVKGNLTIAGVTNAVTMLIKIQMPEKGKILFEGSQTIKMTDYNIKPPTALLGTLKTGNDITINFKTIFTVKTN